MYRKIVLAIDCADDNEVRQVQEIAKDICESYHIKGSAIIRMYPELNKRKGLLNTIINNVSKSGKSGLIKSIPYLIKNM